jgi:hypothetical protein
MFIAMMLIAVMFITMLRQSERRCSHCQTGNGEKG